MADPRERWQKLYNMEHDRGATDNEKSTARKLREKLEEKHPEVRQSWREKPDEPDFSGRVPPGEGPGPFDAGDGLPSDTPEGWRGAAAKAADWLRSAMAEAAKGITLNQLARDYTEVEIEGNTRTIHIHVRLPVDVVDDVFETQGAEAVQEYARLVGALVGAELAGAFSDAED